MLKPAFIMRPYRYIADEMVPYISKYKFTQALAMHRLGHPAEKIAAKAGVRANNLARFLQLFEQGRSKKISDFVKRELTPELLCQLYGLADHDGYV